MLRTRVITALVLLGVLVLVLAFARPWGLPVFALLAVGLLINEWLSLLGLSRPTCAVSAGTMAFVLWMVDFSGHTATVANGVMGLAAVAWLALSGCLFATGRFPAIAHWRVAYAMLALLIPSACWFALVIAYRDGLVFLFSVLAIVWAADIAAYFAGRAFGKRKLAPAISPGKTWAGAVGGGIASVVIAAVAVHVPRLDGSFFHVLDSRWPTVAMLAAVLALVVVSVVGDLFESALKRQHGVKDSGHLLPGHGGVFDRLDALLPVVPIAVLLTQPW